MHVKRTRAELELQFNEAASSSESPVSFDVMMDPSNPPDTAGISPPYRPATASPALHGSPPDMPEWPPLQALVDALSKRPVGAHTVYQVTVLKGQKIAVRYKELEEYGPQPMIYRYYHGTRRPAESPTAQPQGRVALGQEPPSSDDASAILFGPFPRGPTAR